MNKREQLLKKLFSNPISKSFTTKELNSLMAKCNCKFYTGGRGSSLKYFHVPTGRILTFDGPHPEKELYNYHIKKVRKFLLEVGEADDFNK